MAMLVSLLQPATLNGPRIASRLLAACPCWLRQCWAQGLPCVPPREPPWSLAPLGQGAVDRAGRCLPSWAAEGPARSRFAFSFIRKPTSPRRGARGKRALPPSEIAVFRQRRARSGRSKPIVRPSWPFCLSDRARRLPLQERPELAANSVGLPAARRRATATAGAGDGGTKGLNGSLVGINPRRAMTPRPSKPWPARSVQQRPANPGPSTRPYTSPHLTWPIARSLLELPPVKRLPHLTSVSGAVVGSRSAGRFSQELYGISHRKAGLIGLPASATTYGRR